jgi:hypothetical protein
VLIAALIVNLVVLVPVTVLLLVGGRFTVSWWGQITPSRGILLAVYLSFISSSVLFLFWPLEPAIITLLALQITYKILSAFTVRVMSNPVVIANLLVAAFHTGALVLTLPASRVADGPSEPTPARCQHSSRMQATAFRCPGPA